MTKCKRGPISSGVCALGAEGGLREAALKKSYLMLTCETRLKQGKEEEESTAEGSLQRP